MGLQTASVRHPQVMAPALTESTKIHFTLSKDHLNDERSLNIYTEETFLKHKQKYFKVNHLKEISAFCDVNNEFVCENSRINSDISFKPFHGKEVNMDVQKMVVNITTINKVRNTKNKQFFSNSEAVCDNFKGDDPISNEGASVIQENSYFKSKNQDHNSVNDFSADNEIFSMTGTDLPNNFSFEKDLLENVDVMGIELEDQQEDIDNVNVRKELQAKDLLIKIEKKHSKIIRKLDFLRRRAHKLQAKLLGQQISYEISGVFENVHRQLPMSKDFYDLNKEMLSSKNLHKMKPLSDNSVKSLGRKLEITTILQANSLCHQKHYAKYFGTGSVEVSLVRNTSNGTVNILPWSEEQKCEMRRVSRHLKTQLSLSQNEMDSEATESSSGGESCDEMYNYNNPHQQYLSVAKRALWRYSVDRAVIASRWTWLQAQISDIEYRIRLHSDMHKQIRTGKGYVELGRLNVKPAFDALIQPATVNGYCGDLPGKVNKSKKYNEENHCARTRPLINFKKRKLMQIPGLHAVSKRAARPSTIKCGCVFLTEACAVCTGRCDPTYPRDPPDTKCRSEKIALIDPSFHPVVSLSEDASQSIHMEGIMKISDWQQKTARMKTAKNVPKSDKFESMFSESSNKHEHRRKYRKVLRSNTNPDLGEKIKPQLRRRRFSKNPLHRISGKRLYEKDEALLNVFSAENVDEEVESISNNAKLSFDTPNTSPLLQMQSISGYNRKGRADSYDIDNIVIPYSIAASTRVEKLQYKEILTPKWRLAEYCYQSPSSKNNSVLDCSESDVEDLTEESVVVRHDKCELEEKKRFLSYLKLPIGHGGRNRSHRRTDSRTESSGANTPDPMSPYNLDQQDNTNSPLHSPPDTPLSVQIDEGKPLPSIALMRRRTLSQSKLIKEKEVKEDNFYNVADIVEISPYEKRNFPIDDEMYENMLKNMPENHQFTTNSKSQDSDQDDTSYYIDDEKNESADSESTESAIGDGEEDPNDPEWSDIERSNREKYKR